MATREKAGCVKSGCEGTISLELLVGLFLASVFSSIRYAAVGIHQGDQQDEILSNYFAAFRNAGLWFGVTTYQTMATISRK